MKRRDFLLKTGVATACMQGAAYAGGTAKAPRPARNGFASAFTTSAEPVAESGPGSSAIALHPENPKYFLFRGKPLVLVAATEHYGSVVNRPFDFTRYLVEASSQKQTLTRTFLLFRELQSARNPCSPVKPDSPDYIAPWPRTGPGKAIDGEPKYDLDQWNSEYFDRLHRFLDLASNHGIVVELTVFSNTYSDTVWSLNPLRDKNNLQGIGRCEWQEYNSLRDPGLVERQVAYARKIIQETSGYDNVYYEICNEPGGGLPHHVTPAEVDAWQQEIGRTIRDEMRRLNRPHLVFGQNAFSYAPAFSQDFDPSFSGALLDAVTVHPLPDLHLGGRTYQLGNFMSKELQLREFRDFFLAAYGSRKPCVSDEDNTASIYRDATGWTIHRKRAWMAIMTGAHYDYIDFSITVGSEAGTEESRRQIRSWMRNLSDFIHSFDIIHAQPAPAWIETKPAPLIDAVLAQPGREYIAYLADAREVADPGAGHPVSGTIAFSLPEGNYLCWLYSPTTGEYSPGIDVGGGKRVTYDLSPFVHDIVLCVRRQI